MKSLLSKEYYEVTFKRLIKKAIIISAVIHLLIFLPMLVTSSTREKRQIYTPVYSVNLVTQVKPVKKKKKTTTKKAAKKKKKKKKKTTKKKKKTTKKKTQPKKNALKMAKKPHLDKEKKPAVKPDESEKNLMDALAKIRKDVETKDQLEETLKKIKEQVKDREPEPEKKEEEIEVASNNKVEPSNTTRSYGQLTRNNMNITEKKYYNMIWKRIKDSWILPSGISEKNKEMTTVVVIRIEKDGSVSKIKIEEKSGSSYYDESAIRAIKKAEPFPKFIEGMNRDFFKVGVRFRPSE
ncbi:energy transducer TonB [Thermodesulfobacteriota bacterium]